MILFKDSRATAMITTRADEPDLVEQVGFLRQYCFARAAASLEEPYGLDEYDDYYKQLIVLDEADKTIIGGLRLGLGTEIVAPSGEAPFFTAKQWEYRQEMLDIARKGIELGRVWVHPNYQRRFLGLSLLWKSLAVFLAGTKSTNSTAFLFGSVPLVGYSDTALELIVNYLWHYHRADEVLVVPRREWQLQSFDQYAASHASIAQTEGLGELLLSLRDIEPLSSIPVLLKYYIRLGAQIAGGFSCHPSGNKVSALIIMPTQRIQDAVERFYSL